MDRKAIDYFSYLPDALLLVIVSFLPFKDAARSSVLSQRWRKLWFAVKNIDFDEKFFVKNEEFNENRGMQRMAFVSLIEEWMEKCVETELHSFRLTFSCPEEYRSEMQGCIRFCVDRKVKELSLDFSNPEWDENDIDENHEIFLELPPYGSHTMLESLKLYACNFHLIQFDSFARLKNVYLGWIRLPSCYIKYLFSICPSLEILNLKRCWNMENFYIDAKSLRVLVLDKCLGPDMIIIDAPNLSFFQYSGTSIHLQIEYHPRLVEVALDFRLQTDYIGDEGDMLYNFLAEISSVIVLTICSYTLQQIVTAEDPLILNPLLANVKHLILKTDLHKTELFGITFFLNSCPQLEMLTIELAQRTVSLPHYRPPYRYKDHPFSTQFQYPPSREHVSVYPCVTNSLRAVRVKGYSGWMNELIVLRYLLRYGRVLEDVVISLSKEKGHYGNDMEPAYRRNVEKLMEFETASPNVEVHIVP